MRLPCARRPHQQQPLFRRRILAHESLHQQLRLFDRLLVLRTPGLSVRQIRRVTFKIAMLIPLRDPRPLHHQTRALFHPALTRHGHAARRAILSRHQLPSCPSANRAILSCHDLPLECGSSLPLLRSQSLTQTIRLLNRSNLPALFRQSPSYVPIHRATIGLPCGNLCTKTKTPRCNRGLTYNLKLITYHCSYLPTRGAAFTIAVRDGFSSVRAIRDNSCCTTCANSPICRSISIIFSRIFRMISIPARFTPMSRASVKITSSRSRSESVYSRVFPWDREGFSKPTRSYRRSVCGCSLYSSATALIMYPALARFLALSGMCVKSPQF